MKQFVRFLALFAQLAWPICAQNHQFHDTALAQYQPVRIEVKSSWGGLGTPLSGTFRIDGKNGDYKSNGRKVSATAVQELLAALEIPATERPSLNECGADEGWLSANYIPALTESTHRKISQLSRKQVELFRGKFTNPSSAQAAFEELFKGWHTDDFPKLSVTVSVGGREYGVTSDSQFPFMLPWFGIDRPRGGYSCRISRAIAAVIEQRFPNRSRLVLGGGLRWNLAQQVMVPIRREWNFLDTENRIGTEVAQIFARFTLLKSEISRLSSVDLDGDQSWNAELSASDLPSNLVIGVSLRYHDKVLNGTDDLLARAPKFAELVTSVPWLQNFLEHNVGARVEVRYVNGVSLSPKALSSLQEDLRSHRRATVAETIAQNAKEAAFIEIDSGGRCWSRAVVLPTRQIALWNFKCDSALGHPAEDFTTWDYYGWRSTGTLISPDGTIMK